MPRGIHLKKIAKLIIPLLLVLLTPLVDRACEVILAQVRARTGQDRTVLTLFVCDKNLDLNGPVLNLEPPETVGTSNTISWTFTPNNPQSCCVSGATFVIQLSDTADFSHILQTVGPIPQTSYTFTNLQLNVTYYYRVRVEGNCVSKPGAFSNTEFSKQVPPSTPTPTPTPTPTTPPKQPRERKEPRTRKTVSHEPCITCLATLPVHEFFDVPSNHWAKQYIENLHNTVTTLDFPDMFTDTLSGPNSPLLQRQPGLSNEPIIQNPDGTITLDRDLIKILPVSDFADRWQENSLRRLMRGNFYALAQFWIPPITAYNDQVFKNGVNEFGTFEYLAPAQADRPILRWEFVRQALNANCLYIFDRAYLEEQIREGNIPEFKDLPISWEHNIKNDEIFRYVYSAAYYGIVHGYDDQLFRFMQNINREEAIKIALNASGLIIPDNFQAKGTVYNDVGLNNVFVRFIEYSTELGVVNGFVSSSGGRAYAPKREINRAENAKIINNFIEFIGDRVDTRPWSLWQRGTES